MHVPFRLGPAAVALVLLTAPARADTWPAGHEIGVRHYCTSITQLTEIAELYRRGDHGAAQALQMSGACNITRRLVRGVLVEPITEPFTVDDCTGRGWVVEVDERPVYLLLPDPAHHQSNGTLPCA